MRVLLAESRPDVRSALRLILEQRPHTEVIDVSRSDAIMSAMEEVCPDLLLLDWELPGLDAGGLLKALHERCPRLRVIVISGRSELRQEAISSGADDFVSKGDSPQELLKAIGDF